MLIMKKQKERKNIENNKNILLIEFEEHNS